jgi:hypothetical protein
MAKSSAHDAVMLPPCQGSKTLICGDSRISRRYNFAMYSIYELIVFFIIVLGIIYWWKSRDNHTFALQSVRRYCEKRNIQLLDETLVFQSFIFATLANNKKYFCRKYIFDFCASGTDRHRGELLMRGDALARVVLKGEELEITEF